ncbi:MAG: glycosyltransferase [Armatimonadetes bacterium]|nr:glycosyltransferase [Armatimonadota bacterium]
MHQDHPRTILYVHADAGLYGSGVSLLELASRLPPDRYRAVVALPEDGPLGEALRERGVEVLVLPLGTLRRTFRPDHVAAIAWQNYSAPRRLARLVRERSICAIHSNNSHVLTGAFAARRAGVPHIIHVRENLLPPRAVSVRISRLLFELSERVIVVSQGAAAEFLGANASHPKVQIVYNGVDLCAFSSEAAPAAARAVLGWPEANPHVGVIARLTPWKGHEVFLRAAARVADVCPSARFVIVGDVDTPRNRGYKQRLLDLCARLGIAERVRWTGLADRVQGIIAALDLAVVPSVRPEPFGRSLIEAMAMERPVIATNHGGPPEILSGGGGLLVQPGDPEALAAAMIELIENEDLRLAMAATAKREATRRFDIDSHVGAVVRIYDEMLDSSPESGA